MNMSGILVHNTCYCLQLQQPYLIEVEKENVFGIIVQNSEEILY